MNRTRNSGQDLNPSMLRCELTVILLVYFLLVRRVLSIEYLGAYSYGPTGPGIIGIVEVRCEVMLGEAPEIQRGNYLIATGVSTLGKTDNLMVVMSQGHTGTWRDNRNICGADEKEWCLSMRIESADRKSVRVGPHVRLGAFDFVQIHYQQDPETLHWRVEASINHKPALTLVTDKPAPSMTGFGIVNACWDCTKPISTAQFKRFNITLTEPDMFFGRRSGIVESDQVSAEIMESHNGGISWEHKYVNIPPPL